MTEQSSDVLTDDVDYLDIPSPTESFKNALEDDDLAQVLGFPSNLALSPPCPNYNSTSLSGFSPESYSTLTTPDSSAAISQNAAFPTESQFRSTHIVILAQPCYTSRLRSREDHIKEKRRHTLIAKNNDSSFTGPAIRIPECYINTEEQYYIGIFLVTDFHENSNCYYFHPYELEDIDDESRNEKDHGVWYPINRDNHQGIRIFPSLRISKRSERDLKERGQPRVFYGFTLDSNLLNNVVPDFTSGRKLVEEYNFKITKLAFTIGKKRNTGDKYPVIFDPRLTVFSDPMTEGDGKETSDNNRSTTSNLLLPPDCRMYKYAPRNGSTKGEEEVLIFYTRKLEEKKYGALHVTFECDLPHMTWRESLVDTNIELNGQMVCLKTPSFPFTISKPTRVKIILQQEKRSLETLEYFYMAALQCSTCLTNTMTPPSLVTRNKPNKRSKSGLIANDDEIDGVVPVQENKPVLQQSKSQPDSRSSNSPLQLPTTTTQTNNDGQQILEKLEETVISLFTSHDFKPLLNLCRPFIRKRPQLLHIAIDNNYFDLLLKFIPVASIDLLQQTNQLGESALLHALRLNRLDIIKTILEKRNSSKLLDDVNVKQQNILHILAMNKDQEEMLELFMDYIVGRSIDIVKKLDDTDEDDHTPLELSIMNNNLSATRHFLKHCDNNMSVTNDENGDNLIHLAVRYGDLIMLKYLLGEEQMKKQGTQTNFTMTPVELARSLKRNEMVEYLNEIYPPPVLDEDND